MKLDRQVLPLTSRNCVTTDTLRSCDGANFKCAQRDVHTIHKAKADASSQSPEGIQGCLGVCSPSHSLEAVAGTVVSICIRFRVQLAPCALPCIHTQAAEVAAVVPPVVVCLCWFFFSILIIKLIKKLHPHSTPRCPGSCRSCRSPAETAP